MFLYTGEILLYIIWGPQNKGDPLVNALGLHIQDRLGACGCCASRLLNDVGHRIALIQEPELRRNSRGMSCVGGQTACALPLTLRRSLNF